MAYMPSLPSVSPVIKNLHYVSEENLVANESNGGSIFGGHPSLQQREESFDIKETMKVYCGYVYVPINLLFFVFMNVESNFT